MIADRAGLAFGVGAWIKPMRLFTFGLSYEHVGLGREVGGTGNPDYFDISRSLNTLWADARAHFFRTASVRLSALLGLGVNWQNAAAAAAFSQDIGQPLFTVRCTANDSANFSFRGGLGARFVIGNGVSFLLDAVIDEVRLSTAPLDECVTGGGAMTLLSARAGIAYGFDITRVVR